MHTHYTVCSLQGNAVYRSALATQVPSLPLAVGYQNKNACICLGHVLQELRSSFLPIVNQQQIIFRAADRPWAG